MPMLFRLVSVAVLLLFSWSPFCAIAAQESTSPAKVAKVGNLVVTQEDVDRRAQELMPMQVGFHGNVSAEKIAEIRQNALDELINRAYKIQYAINEEISVEAPVFEQAWQKRLGKNPQLAAAAQAKSPQASKIKADLYLDMLAQKAESVSVDDKVTVSDQEVAAYYKEHKAKYFRPKLFTASHVFVRVDPSSNAEERKVKQARAEELMKRAETGEDFYNLAYYESDDRSKYVGGSLGSFHAGQTVAEFDAAIQSMKPGEVKGPVRTIYGFHIIKLDTVEEERQLQFDEVSTKIRSSLIQEEREKLYDKWMSMLKAKYPIERFGK